MNFFNKDRLYFSCTLLALALLFGASNATAAELRASVDRTEISENETLTLTIRLDEQVGRSSPDFSRLEKDFEILSQQRSSQFHNINGRSESWTDWTLILAPKASGKLSIPAFRFQGTLSQPLEITVTQSNKAAPGELRDVFVEVETDKPEVFVQEQLLVTFKIHTGIQLRDASMDEDLTVENAVVESVSETAYSKQLDGRLYQVIELVYAVFPQQSGTIDIPSLTWNLIMASDRGAGLRYRFQAPGDLRRVRSEPLTVSIKAKPERYTGDQWLPARDVQLEQHWSSSPSRFVVGEPLTRTITLKADGLSSAQLPPLPEQSTDGLKTYSDQPQFDDQRSNQGVVGNRIESVAIMPTRAGELTLPEMQVSWWDTETQQQRQASLPSQVLTVAPATASTVPPLTPSSPQPSADPPAEVKMQTSNPIFAYSLLGNALLAGLTLFFMFAWLRVRKPPTRGAENGESEEAESLTEAFNAVRLACSKNDPRAVRRALGEWGQGYWQLNQPASLQDIVQRSDSATLTKELADLDKILYGTYQSNHARADDWRGDALWRALVKFKRKDKKQRRDQALTNKAQLPPLYPTR